MKHITQDAQSSRDERDKAENTNKEAGRDAGQTHDYKGEAQNANNDTGRPP